MHDPMEYPSFQRQQVWYVDVPALANLGSGQNNMFSPLYDLDRGMGIRAGNAPTANVSSGNPDHGFETIPIGNRVIVSLYAEGAALTHPLFQVWADCSGASNPITRRFIRSTTIPIGIGTSLEIDFVLGFPFVQFRVVNADAEATVAVCGCVRITPIQV